MSAHREMQPEAKPVGAAPGEAVASCNSAKAQTGDVQTHPRHWHPAL